MEEKIEQNEQVEEKIEDKAIVVVALGCEYSHKPAIGSIIRNCNICRKDVWIAPSWKGKKIDKIICVDCYEKNFGRDSQRWEDEIDMAITEEQMEEFNAYHKEKFGYTVTSDELIKEIEAKFKRKVILKKKAD